MTPPRFDALAPHYRWLETASYGGLLQWCRTALLSELGGARTVLILGEGDGWFAAAFLAAYPNAAVDVIDASLAMIARARTRVAAVPGAAARARWHTADARRADPPGAAYDLIVTNFFLDCFPVAELAVLVPRLAARLTPGGRWLVGDFALPERPAARLAARAALAGMYGFFRLVTRIPAGRLADPAPHLRAAGLTVEREATRLGGFLAARLWRAGGVESREGRGDAR